MFVRTMNKILPELKRIYRMTIYGIVRVLDATGSVLDGRHWQKGRLKSVRWWKTFQNEMWYWQNTKEICKASFQSIGNVSSVYRLLKFELKSSPYISSIQQKVHFFKNKREMAAALGVLTFFPSELP